jgi:hypothetical protein
MVAMVEYDIEYQPIDLFLGFIHGRIIINFHAVAQLFHVYPCADN